MQLGLQNMKSGTSLAVFIAVLAFAVVGAPLGAQDDSSQPPSPGWDIARDGIRDALERIWIPKSRLTNGPHVRAAFRDVVAKASQATVRVRAGGTDATLGSLVGPDGWVLTKASSLRGELTVLLSDGRELDARIVGISREHDLAMLKVDAQQLPVLELDESVSIVVGHWVASSGADRDPVAVGVVSVGERVIPHRPGILGIQLDDSEYGPRVVRVFPETGAAEAGILVNDVVTSINGEPTPTRSDLINQVRRHSPGDEIQVGIQRNGESLEIRAFLTGRLADDRLNFRQYQNNLGTKLSRRRFGFPSVFQHDSILQPSDCGGPLVDLDGKVIGFNIARAGRTESYAIPTRVVVPLLYDLMAGNLSPE